MTLRLNGSTSGYVEIDAPATAGSNTLVLPTGNGTNGQYLQTNGSGSLSWAGVSGLPAQALTLGTSVASTSGTAIDFTGIPSTVKRVTVMLNGVSLNGTADFLVQIGAGSIATTGYNNSVVRHGTSSGNIYATSTSGFLLGSSNNAATDVTYGHVVLTSVSGNTWVVLGSIGTLTTGGISHSRGGIALAGTLDRIRITTSNGTDTFDAGSINILYEG